MIKTLLIFFVSNVSFLTPFFYVTTNRTYEKQNIFDLSRFICIYVKKWHLKKKHFEQNRFAMPFKSFFKYFCDKMTFSVCKTRLVCSESKYEKKPTKLIKTICSQMFSYCYKLFWGWGIQKWPSIFQIFKVFRTFQHFRTDCKKW